MARLDLRFFLEKFDEVCRKRFGQPLTARFAKLEKDFSFLRDGKQPLKASYIKKLFAPDLPYHRYWRPPDEKAEEALRQADLRLEAPPGGEAAIADRLMSLLHDLGTVSLVLRFTYPERFGVFSAPVVDMLQVYHGRVPQLYAEYCRELEKWRSRFRLPTVAHTEMALWTIHQIQQHGTPEEQRHASEAFHADVSVQRLRAARSLGPLLARRDPLELAEILAEQSPRLAGMIAGAEYERVLRAAGQGRYPRQELDGREILARLEDLGVFTAAEREMLKEVWRTRNACVHPSQEPALDTVEHMIEVIRRFRPRLERGS